MTIIPAINCTSINCFNKRLKEAEKFLPKNGWIHIDFAKEGEHSNGSSVVDWVALAETRLNVEIHAMVDKKDVRVGGPFKRLLVHWDDVDGALKDALTKEGKELGVAVGYAEKINEEMIGEDIRFMEVLAVAPGKSGQEFNKEALSLITFLKKKYPHAILSVDGGVDAEIAKEVRDAGADILIVGSAIWNTPDPAQAYRTLAAL